MGFLSFILVFAHARTLTAHPPGSGEQPSIPGIFGLSTHKVYPPQQLPEAVVSSYLTFSPLPAATRTCRRFFSVALALSPV